LVSDLKLKEDSLRDELTRYSSCLPFTISSLPALDRQQVHNSRDFLSIRRQFKLLCQQSCLPLTFFYKRSLEQRSSNPDENCCHQGIFCAFPFNCPPQKQQNAPNNQLPFPLTASPLFLLLIKSPQSRDFFDFDFRFQSESKRLQIMSERVKFECFVLQSSQKCGIVTQNTSKHPL
jgi:hypothetical protein